jgi:hypothetical protein
VPELTVEQIVALIIAVSIAAVPVILWLSWRGETVKVEDRHIEDPPP